MWLRAMHSLGLTNLSDEQVQHYEEISKEKKNLRQQQLVLLILSAVIVGAALITGINMFGKNTLQASQEDLTLDIMTIASRAQAWYNRPAELGGGGHSFSAITLDALNFTSANAHGSYEIYVLTDSTIRISGTTSVAEKPLRVEAVVTPTRIDTTIIKQSSAL